MEARDTRAADPIEERKLKMQIQEGIERSKRQENLILIGVPEYDKKDEVIGQIIDVLVPEVQIKFRVMGRVGRRSDLQTKPRPIRLVFEDQIHKRRILT